MIDRLPQRLRFLAADQAGAFDPAASLARFSTLFLLAVLPFSHNAALKNFALLGLLTATLWLAAQRRLAIDWHSPILRVLAALLTVLAVTATLGSDPLDSLGELRKHFLPGILLLLLIPQVFQGERLMRLVLSVIALSFMLRAGLTLIELAEYFPDLDSGRSEGNFIKGFSLDAGFYVPALMGLLLLGGRWRWLAPLGLLAVLIVMLLVQSRTPVVAASLSLVVMLFVLRKWRILLFFAAAVVFAGGYLTISQSALSERFAQTFNLQTYARAIDTKNYVDGDGFSGRTPIWFGILEITANRSLTGYGFGWKKMGKIAVEGGYVTRWETKKNDNFAKMQAWYFSLPTSKVNPHNLYLQIYFESGLLGLAAYLLMLLVLFWQAFRLSWRAKGERRIIAAVALAYLVSHVTLGLANGLWIGLGPSLALIALLETVRRSEKTA
jgi:O-antigen ligase